MPGEPEYPFHQQFLAFARSLTPDSRLRLAPTPSGYLHLGNALNFILNWLAARHTPGARLLLRIDDLDADRKRPEYVQDVFDTLHWLGLDWEDGPRDATDFESHWSQYRRLDAYNRLLQILREKNCLFACQKSRKALAPYEGGYPTLFREQGLSLDDPDVAWRICTPPGAALPDFVVRRRDGVPAYQIANVADDLYFGITHIIRGADLSASTEAQLFLAEMIGASAFMNIRFLFHPLLLDASGQKLSKSAGAAALAFRRMQGENPEFVFQAVARLLQMRADPDAVSSAAALLAAFRLEVGNQ
jgi:glutamyl/glutaminyl-tRNA synthetase